MAGTDGPLMFVDRDTGHTFISIGIYGSYPFWTADNQPFTLSDIPVNKTVVMRSIDGGLTWTRVATLNYRAWRLEVTPLGDDHLMFAEENYVHRKSIPALVPTEQMSAAVDQIFSIPGDPIAWSGNVPEGPVTSLRTRSVGARLPGPQPGLQLVLLSDTENRQPAGRKGWRAFSFDWNVPDHGFFEFKPAIMPEDGGQLDFVFNPVVVDLGTGPVFAYWYDVRWGGGGQAVKMRGRLFLGEGRQTVDFTIRPRFTVTTRKFFGHYQMAGGYHRIEPSGLRRTVFYPVWVEPGDMIRFARVEYQETGGPPNELGEVAPGILVSKPTNRIAPGSAIISRGTPDRHKEHAEEETRLESGTFLRD